MNELVPLTTPRPIDDRPPRVGQAVVIEMCGPNGGRLVFTHCRIRSMEREIGLGEPALKIVLDSLDMLIPKQDDFDPPVGGDIYPEPKDRW